MRVVVYLWLMAEELGREIEGEKVSLVPTTSH